MGTPEQPHDGVWAVLSRPEAWAARQRYALLALADQPSSGTQEVRLVRKAAYQTVGLLVVMAAMLPFVVLAGALAVRGAVNPVASWAVSGAYAVVVLILAGLRLQHLRRHFQNLPLDRVRLDAGPPTASPPQPDGDAWPLLSRPEAWVARRRYPLLLQLLRPSTDSDHLRLRRRAAREAVWVLMTLVVGVSFPFIIVAGVVMTWMDRVDVFYIVGFGYVLTVGAVALLRVVVLTRRTGDR